MMKFATALRLLAVSAALVIGGCGGADGQESDGDGEDEPQAVPVEVAPVVLGRVHAAFAGTTTLEADREADIVAKVGGVVLELLVEEGDRVNAGQVVARLDRERLALQVRQARVGLDKLESDFRRTRELHDKNLVSRDVFETQRYDLESQKAALALAELELSYTDVRSPISGVISERMVKVGHLATQYEALFRVDDFDPLLGVLHVPERELNTLRQGQEAVLQFEALGDADFIGQVARISPVVDAGSGTFKVTVEIDDPDPRLKPGMFGRVEVVYDVRDKVVTIPRDALILEDRGAHVFVVEDGLARKVAVRTGYTTAGRVEVLDALSVGSLVVTAGKGSISDQTRLDVINAPASTVAAGPEQPTDDAQADSL